MPQMQAEAGIEAVLILRRVHALPQGLKHRCEALGMVQLVLQQGGEPPARQQVHVLGEHGEDAPHQEMGDLFRRMLLLQPFRHLGQPLCDLAGDAGRLARRVQRQGFGPDGLQPLDDLRVAQILQPDPEALAVGEVGVRPAAARKVGIDLEHIADVADDDEGRGGVVGRQAEDIVLGLTPGVAHQHVPLALRRGGRGGFVRLEQRALPVVAMRRPRLFGLQDEAAALVQVDPQGRG